MPIDPSIPLGVRMPEIQNPMQTLGSLMQLQAAQQQARAGQMDLRAKERAFGDDAALRTAIQRRARPGGAPDWDAVTSDLDAQGFGPLAMKVRDSVFEQRKKLAEGLKTQYENSETRLKLASQIAQGVSDEGSFQRGKKAIAGLLGDDLASQLGETYDPARMKQVLAWGQSASDFLTKQRDAVTAAHKAIELAATSARDAEAARKNAPEIAKLWTTAASNRFSVTQSQEDWDRAKAELQFGGAPDALLGAFGETWSPDAVKRATQLGISPEKRAELAGQAEGRAQTAAYQRGQLALGAERIGVMRKQLAASQTQPEQMGPVADMVLDNPDVLKDFTPKERGKILTFIANEREGALPNKRRDSMISMLDGIDATIAQLEGSKGMAGAVGAKGATSLFGYMDKPMSGTAAADFVSQFDTLKAQLALPKLEFLRGLGAMSDREFKTIGDATTSLSRSQSEPAFKSELKKVKETSAAMRQRLLGATTPTNTVPGSAGSRVPLPSGTVRMQAPDGRTLNVPSDQVDEAKARGARVVP